jgi:hypothetical protein
VKDKGVSNSGQCREAPDEMSDNARARASIITAAMRAERRKRQGHASHTDGIVTP